MVCGQDDGLKEIRRLYADTNKKIAKSKLPGDGGWGNFYSTQMTVNSNNGSWRGSGNYSNKVTFWYKDQPGFDEEKGKSAYSILVKIEIETIVAASRYVSEFLYDEGKLVFHYSTSSYATVPKDEYRYYFRDGKLFRYQENQNDIKDLRKAGAKEITDKSLKMQKLFLGTFATEACMPSSTSP